MFNFKTDAESISAELADIARLFTDEYDEAVYNIAFIYGGVQTIISINETVFEYEKAPLEARNKLEIRKQFVRQCKNALYKALNAYFKRDMPWGSLTGIRPSKLVYDALNGGAVLSDIPDILQNDFFVSPEKAHLITKIVKNQNGFFTREPEYVNLYIHIPFCPSRCNYCSFVSVPMDKQRALVAPYIDKLCEEIKASKRQVEASRKKIYSVYIGGGTPTALDDTLLERVLKTAADGLPSGIEFTCEAGRPETITEAKTALMKNYGITRVSVNPQSLNPQTLSDIGRHHTVEDFFTAYGLVKKAGFIINTDLIAGLANETPDDFSNTLKKIIELRPDNITVHTLSRKRGSSLKENEVKAFAGGVKAMTDYAEKSLTDTGYLPYYLYRQKLMLENLENVGYSLPGAQCVNNITVMEEMLSVNACGAGAISKLILPEENRIERLANIKDIKLYLEQFDRRLVQKEDFFRNKD